MRDDFEKELQDILSGFDRQPDANLWQKIMRRIQGGSSPFPRPSGFLLGAMVILLGSWFWFQEQPNSPGQQGSVPSQAIKDFIRVDTIYSIDRNGNETMSIDTVFFDTAIFALYKKGSQLYRKQCSVCHSMDMLTNASGPALGGITKIRSRDWLYAFTRNSQAMIAAKDPVALEVWERWKPAVMINFLDLTDDDLDAIYAFIEIKTSGKFIPESGKQ